MSDRPTRTALRFYGGKSAIAPWIVDHFPAHVAYLEPFGGGASVLLAKDRVDVETYNDLDGAVCAFFRCLRDDADALIRSIELTPFSREEVDRAEIDAPDITDLERARRLYLRSHQTIHGAPTRENTGWRCERKGGGNARGWASAVHLWTIAERLCGVQIERDDALRAIKRFATPDTLIYADPPYLSTTRGRRWRDRSYAFEFGNDEHRMLADALHASPAMVVLSGYASPLYAELYADWERVDRPARTQSGAEAVECLWRNPAAVERMK